jgi:hypothetical protein
MSQPTKETKMQITIDQKFKDYNLVNQIVSSLAAHPVDSYIIIKEIDIDATIGNLNVYSLRNKIKVSRKKMLNSDYKFTRIA